MGWNTSALFVQNRNLDQVITLLPDVFEFQRTGETVDGERATSRGDSEHEIFMRQSGSWCELWDPGQRFPPRVEKMHADSDGDVLRGTRALAVVFSSVSSTYGFWWYEDGKLVRHAMFESDRKTADVGAPLPVEVRLQSTPSWGPDEDFLWAVIEDRTGQRFEMDHRYEVVAFDF